MMMMKVAATRKMGDGLQCVSACVSVGNRQHGKPLPEAVAAAAKSRAFDAGEGSGEGSWEGGAGGRGRAEGEARDVASGRGSDPEGVLGGGSGARRPADDGADVAGRAGASVSEDGGKNFGPVRARSLRPAARRGAQSPSGGKDAGASGIAAGGPSFIANPTLTHHPVVCGGRAPPFFRPRMTFTGVLSPDFGGFHIFMCCQAPYPKW